MYCFYLFFVFTFSGLFALTNNWKNINNGHIWWQLLACLDYRSNFLLGIFFFPKQIWKVWELHVKMTGTMLSKRKEMGQFSLPFGSLANQGNCWLPLLLDDGTMEHFKLYINPKKIIHNLLYRIIDAAQYKTFHYKTNYSWRGSYLQEHHSHVIPIMFSVWILCINIIFLSNFQWHYHYY